MVLSIGGVNRSLAQPDKPDEAFYDLDQLEKLLNTTIESASLETESLFESPLSSTVITQKQIQNSGVRSVMEALRLAPGLIVREQTAGNYDVHIRGLDSVPPNSYLFDYVNNKTLVMIDYRVVFNYYSGGTFWETFPIAINDVERIEIVRGPASALYGPNAVTGVINIITKKKPAPSIYSSGSFKLDPITDQQIAAVDLGYANDSINIKISSNYTKMDRFQTEYFSSRLNAWVPRPEDIPGTMLDGTIQNAKEKYPHPGLALEAWATNLFVDYQLNPVVSFSFDAHLF